MALFWCTFILDTQNTPKALCKIHNKKNIRKIETVKIVIKRLKLRIELLCCLCVCVCV